MKFSYLNPDGTRLAIEFDRDWPLSSPGATVDVVAKLNGRSPDAFNSRRLTVAVAGNAQSHIEHAMQGRATQRLTGRAGEIRLAPGRKPGDRGVIFWEGANFEVSSFAPYSVSMSPKTAVRLLDGLRFVDAPDGLEIVADATKGERVDVVSSSVYIDGVGMLDILNPARALSVIPSWAGKKVAVGEVWHFPDEFDSRADYYVVGTDSAALVVMPGEYPHEAALSFVSSIVNVTYN